MSDILTQREIDNLISGLANTSEVAAPAGRDQRTPAKARRVRVYDFRRPDKFSKEQIRTLEMIHDNLARMMTTTVSAMIRTMVQVEVTAVDQMTYDEFIQSMASPTVIGIFAVEPLAGKIICEVQPGIAFPIVDRLLGGPGLGSERVRQMTEIELTIMERVVCGIMTGLAEAWSNVSDLKPTLDKIETNPLFAQIIGSNDMVASITLDVRLGEHEGTINICLPFLVLEPLMPKLSAHHWFSSIHKRVTPDQQERLRENLEDAVIPLAVELGRTTLTVGELYGLQVGDVIRMDEALSNDVSVIVGNEIRFTGQAGTLGRKMAVRISRVVDEGGE